MTYEEALEREAKPVLVGAVVKLGCPFDIWPEEDSPGARGCPTTTPEGEEDCCRYCWHREMPEDGEPFGEPEETDDLEEVKRKFAGAVEKAGNPIKFTFTPTNVKIVEKIVGKPRSAEAWELGRDTVNPHGKDDPVNHPSHYTAGGIECIDAIAAALTCQKDPMEAWLTGQVLKYLWRWPLKNGKEDLEKARFYLNRLIEKVGK